MPNPDIVIGLPEPTFIKEMRRHQVHETIIEMMNNREIEALKLLKQHIESAIAKCEGS